jgi:hypothetical protein
MRKAGGIIGIVAGVFGTLAAIMTLFLGGVGSALNADKADLLVNLGWGGLVAAFLTIVLGAVAAGSSSSWPGILLAVTAVVGAIFGGVPVAICMVLALAGGLLAAIGARQERKAAALTPGRN